MDLGRPEGIPFPAGFSLPFLPYGFPTLAIIVAVTTYLQTKLTMPPTGTGGAGDQGAAMNSMMSIYMPLLLGYFALNFASGSGGLFHHQQRAGHRPVRLDGPCQLAQRSAGRLSSRYRLRSRKSEMGRYIMNERTTFEIIAPTVEEALAQGLAQLGLPASAVSVEVLDSGNKGLFGLGGRQVRVRLTVNRPGDELVTPPAPVQKKPAPSAAPSAPAARSRNETRAPRSRPAPASAPEKAPSAPAAVSAPVASHASSASPAAPASADTSMGEISHGLNDPVLDKTEATISKLLFLMGMQAQVSAHYGEARDDRRPIMVDIRGSDLGVLIGRRGETLDAFQYIASLMVGKEVEQFIHLIVDVEGHRDRRQRQLRQLAQRMAEQVIKTGPQADARADDRLRTACHPHGVARSPCRDHPKQWRRAASQNHDPAERLGGTEHGSRTNNNEERPAGHKPAGRFAFV